jgi:hypothetical protein
MNARSSLVRRRLALALAALAVAPCVAHAQEQPAPVPAAPPEAPASVSNPWTIKLDPMVWWVSPAGDLKLPAQGAVAGGSVGLSTLDLDTPEISPAGAASLYVENFRFSFFGSAYSREASGTADSAFQLGDVQVTAGDEFDVDFDFGFYEVSLGYRFLHHNWKESSANPAEAADVAIDLYGLVGGRLYDLDISFASAGSESGTDQFFADVIAGVRAELTIIRDFSINVQASGGGMGDSDRSSYSFDIQVFGEWRPFQNVGVLFGWRHTQFTFEDGDGPEKFEYDGSVAGVFGGVSIRF